METKETNTPLEYEMLDRTVEVLEEQLKIHEALEVLNEQGLPTAIMKIEVHYAHNATYKKRLAEALNYIRSLYPESNDS